MKKVTDSYGREVYIDDDKRKLYSYSNKEKKVTWNAPIVENGEETGFYADYVENGVIDDIELRLNKWDNGLKLAYASYVKFNAEENDPDKKIWNKVVKIIEDHQDDIFDEYGDFKKDFVISEDNIREMIVE